MGAMLSAVRSPRAHVEDVEHRLPNPTARSVAEATDTDVTRTPHSAREDSIERAPFECERGNKRRVARSSPREPRLASTRGE